MLGKELRPSDRVCERRVTCPAQLVLLGLITVTMFGKAYKWYIYIATETWIAPTICGEALLRVSPQDIVILPHQNILPNTLLQIAK
jgi:hypothetical protein